MVTGDNKGHTYEKKIVSRLYLINFASSTIRFVFRSIYVFNGSKSASITNEFSDVIAKIIMLSNSL